VAPVPILVLISALGIWHGVERRMERLPFFLTLFLFLLSYIGLAISLWPHIIPPSISIWQAAAPASSQQFLLVGVVIMIPIILTYTGYNYWTVRGKVGDAGYHD
jgi:cytochrome d ubiquinol oxidase subunit II